MSTALTADQEDAVDSHHQASHDGGAHHVMSEMATFPLENESGIVSKSLDQATASDSSSRAAPIVNTKPAPPTATQAAQMFVFSAAKAGMHEVDKAHVQKVVFEMSKDSLFFQNSIKQNDKVEARIAVMRAKLQALSVARRETLRRQIDAQVATMETARDLSRTVVVVDMDMFYAAVEMRDNPSLRDVPLAVGGIGMLSTTNYVARKFGVRAAMPGFIGKELCPDLVIVPPNFNKYTAISAQIRDIVAHYDPEFRAMSLDEVYCDITDFMETNWARYARTGAVGSHSNSDGSGDEDDDIETIGFQEADDSCTDEFGGGSEEDGRQQSPSTSGFCESTSGSTRKRKRNRTCVSSVVPPEQRQVVAAAIVDEIRAKIFKTTQLTASAGIAANTMLAKICSDFNKPNGQYLLPFTRDDVLAFVETLPVRKIGGIGKVMEKTLHAALGITTGKDLYDRRVEIGCLFSERTASWLLRISMGLQGAEREEESSGRKSYSRERTFSARGIADPRTLEKICGELCDRLAADMQEGGHGAKTITLKLKCVDFSVRSRAVSIARTVRSKDDLLGHAIELLRKEVPLRLRLMGVRASALVALDGTSLADDGSQTRKRQAVMDTFTTSIMASEEVPLEIAQLSADEGDGGSGGVNYEESDDGGVGNTQKNRSLEKKQLAIHAYTQNDTSVNSITSEQRSRVMAKTNPNTLRPSLFGPVQTKAPPTDEPAARGFQPCPICGNMINAGNAIAIDVHIDACLRKSESNQKRRTFQQFFRP